MSEKREILAVGNVRIREYDSMNVQVERYEDVFIPTEKKTVKKWKFKGYARNLISALLIIQRNELLIDQKSIRDLESHLEQVEKSNAALLEVMER